MAVAPPEPLPVGAQEAVGALSEVDPPHAEHNDQPRAGHADQSQKAKNAGTIAQSEIAGQPFTNTASQSATAAPPVDPTSSGPVANSGEVEAAIYEIPEVKEAAVFGIPDEKWGELVAAAVVLRPGTNLSAEELKQHCKTRIASYKVPRRIEFMTEELPKSGSGKILKRVLREKYWAGQSRRV